MFAAMMDSTITEDVTKTKSMAVPVSQELPSRVAVVGSGNFGRAIVAKIRSAGFDVIWGSRNPTGDQVPVEKVMMESLLILAVPSFSWSSLPLSSLQAGCVILEPSNRISVCEPHQQSQAERLQQLLPPGVSVVKCLNTVSAYELENTSFAAGKQIPIASDNGQAKVLVSMFLEKLGYHFQDLGDLDQARTIENIPLALFTEWRRPLLVSTVIWVLLYLYRFASYHTCDHGKLGWYPEGLQDMALKYINKTCDNHALILLALCYLPGILAAYLQLARGTKYSVFPGWLDAWLRDRKQLGLLMLLSASIHGCYYCLLVAPHYSRVMLPSPVTTNGSWDWSHMMAVSGTRHEDTWQTTIYLSAGVLAYFIAVILGVTSLPSVSTALTWKEFRMIQSRLGWFCLILATLHCAANGYGKLFKFHDCFFLGTEQLPLIFSGLTLALKVPLLLPCVDARLTRIREGRQYRAFCC